MGHVLGFDHPDTSPGENLEQVANLTNATCRSPWSVDLAPTPAGIVTLIRRARMLSNALLGAGAQCSRTVRRRR